MKIWWVREEGQNEKAGKRDKDRMKKVKKQRLREREITRKGGNYKKERRTV